METRAEYHTSAQPIRRQQWMLTRRTGSGQFVMSDCGALLFRIDTASGVIFAWDKKAGREIPIRLVDLVYMTGKYASAPVHAPDATSVAHGLQNVPV